MWTGNDFLPAFEKVGWVTAKKFHKEYEELNNEIDKVCCPYICLRSLLYIHVFTFVWMQKSFLVDMAMKRNLKTESQSVQKPHEESNVDDGDPYRELGSVAHTGVF